ncbi:quinone oxidoreductase family protein [Deinococcus pimensis]|uniref:quinone oxidoreductase family protein n=1 Tax=Deinococcus pimensis TaxID=309888 RepID=UPI0004830882|nr:quinone oxidoreductase [Deinococcus pimensis]
MKAIRVHQPGDQSALVLDDVPTPQPGAGEARVAVRFAGLNFIDVYYRTGAYRANLPVTIGNEGMGVVEAVGEGVDASLVGQRVAWAMHPGSYAQGALVPAWKLVPVPDGVSDEVAAALLLQGMTAHYLARSTFELREGHDALVHAAAGGVGGLLVQIARKRGARVIATVGSEEKATLARAAGAHDVILYREQDFAAETKRLTDGRGVHVVYDSVGRDTFDASLSVLRPRGMMVLYGASSGAVPPVDPQVLNQKGSLFLTRPSLGAYTQDREELLWRAGELFDMVLAGELDVRVDRVFDLADAGSAHAYLEGRHTKGKVLLRI